MFLESGSTPKDCIENVIDCNYDKECCSEKCDLGMSFSRCRKKRDHERKQFSSIHTVPFAAITLTIPYFMINNNLVWCLLN